LPAGDIAIGRIFRLHPVEIEPNNSYSYYRQPIIAACISPALWILFANLTPIIHT